MRVGDSWPLRAPGTDRRRGQVVVIAAALLLLLVSELPACAQTGAPFELRWPHHGEKLIYRSDGCADECWIAEVRQKRANRVRARLYCDGETLTLEHFEKPPGRVAGRCDDINENGVRGIKSKFVAIPEILERLLYAGASQDPAIQASPKAGYVRRKD